MHDIDIAIRAARAGAAVVAAGFRLVTLAEMKGVVDPVTATDLASEAAVTAVITAARPDDGILAEEGGATTEGTSGRRWVIDPLDGTVNFIHGIPQVSVSVALEDADGVLVGVIIDPIRDEEFTAVRGEGAFLNGSPLQVSTRDQIGDSIIVTGFPYDRREYGASYAKTVGAVLEIVRGIRRLGSAALDLAWVAAGRYDGYWDYSLSPWDMKAGILLVAEAGGMLSNSAGGPIDHTDLVVTNGRIHEALRRVVAANRPGHLPPAPGAEPAQ
ncbi:MAG: inositol monophosphatase [Acidimicrobiia bacterium]|nr:inositol monophosphatase [Acidimicrobiia bacterium]